MVVVFAAVHLDLYKHASIFTLHCMYHKPPTTNPPQRTHMYTYVPNQEENHLLVTLVEGVRMTDQQLQKVFGANKIVKVHTRISF